jgi:hypothetical protein
MYGRPSLLACRKRTVSNKELLQGLRGIASSLVVLTHVARSFDGDLFSPTDGENLHPRLLQWPFLRILVQGRIGVTIFSFVTGYVCALKPIRLCRQGNQEAAFEAIAKSALRRAPRLILPAALATVLIWVLAQLNLFAVALRCSGWPSATSPGPVIGVVSAIESLMYWTITTWTYGANVYDSNQWTLLPLLKGSMLVYVFCVAFAYVGPRHRMLAALGLWVYFYVGADCTLLPPPLGCFHLLT